MQLFIHPMSCYFLKFLDISKYSLFCSIIVFTVVHLLLCLIYILAGIIYPHIYWNITLKGKWQINDIYLICSRVWYRLKLIGFYLKYNRKQRYASIKWYEYRQNAIQSSSNDSCLKTHPFSKVSLNSLKNDRYAIGLISHLAKLHLKWKFLRSTWERH